MQFFPNDTISAHLSILLRKMITTRRFDQLRYLEFTRRRHGATTSSSQNITRPFVTHRQRFWALPNPRTNECRCDRGNVTRNTRCAVSKTILNRQLSNLNSEFTIKRARYFDSWKVDFRGELARNVPLSMQNASKKVKKRWSNNWWGDVISGE